MRTIMGALLTMGISIFTDAPPPALAQTAPPPVELRKLPGITIDGEEVLLTATPIVLVSGTATWGKAFATLAASFKTLSAFIEKQKLETAGPPITIYISVDNTGFKYQAAVPVKATPTTMPRGTVTAGQSPAGKAFKFSYQGSYDSMDTLYEAITHFLDEKRIERQGLFIEEYLTDPATTTEDKLSVNVFVLVK